jgi:hypothetical protein
VVELVVRANELLEWIRFENSHLETAAGHHAGKLRVRHDLDVMPLGPQPVPQSRVWRNRAERAGRDDLYTHYVATVTRAASMCFICI